MGKIITRFAPSPTGKLHIGNVHTFLFNYCFTKHSGGQVLLRIEDTDAARNKDEYVEDIMQALTWLGLQWDGEVQFQSKRQTNYLKYAEQLLQTGEAYLCYHSTEELDAMRKAQEKKGQAPRYDGSCRNLTPEQKAQYEKEVRKPSIRFRMTGKSRPKEIVYTDLVYGEISYDPELIGDFVIVRSDKSILYNFGNVIDDHEMGVTAVVRGQSHLTNTPRQILIYQALGWDVPEFGHLPEVLNQDRVGKLSKRYGAASVSEFRQKGYLPTAVINFLGSLGWSHPDGKDFFDLSEMVKMFSFERVSKAPAALDLDKLDHINAHYIREIPDEKLAQLFAESLKESTLNDLSPDNIQLIKLITPLLKERAVRLTDIESLAGYFFHEPAKPKFKYGDYNKVLSQAVLTAEKIEPWTKENIEQQLRLTQQESGVSPKEFFVTMGQAISGSDVFLPLFDSLELLGKEIVLARLRHS